MKKPYTPGTVKAVLTEAADAELERLKTADPERAELWEHVVKTLHNLAETNLESAFLVQDEDSRGKSIVLMDAAELAQFILFREYGRRLAKLS